MDKDIKPNATIMFFSKRKNLQYAYQKYKRY